MKIHISDHAIDRYRERVGPLSDDAALSRLEIFGRLADAKPKHVRKIGGGKRTVMVPLADCLLVFSNLTMVTVLERNAA